MEEKKRIDKIVELEMKGMPEMAEVERKEMESEKAKELHNQVEKQDQLKQSYEDIIKWLKYYLDLKEEYYPIIACWIIGTYLHSEMLTYPYLYFNATKESGKSRSVRLITYMSWEGEMVNSMTEAVLFRTKGTLGIDEFERASRKGNENFLELLNSAYKKGTKVKRMKKISGQKGEEMVIEDFEVFRPICLANIWGMDSVLEDRVLTLFLEKTTSDTIPNLLEIWEFNDEINEIKAFLMDSCSLCSDVTLHSVYQDWNDYLTNIYTTTHTNNYTKQHLFDIIKQTGIRGRMLELSFPLILIADMISQEVVESVVNSLKGISIEKNQEAFLENKDVLITDMISQEVPPIFYQSLKIITEKFRQFTQSNEDWINEKWVGRAIKRLSLAKEKKRTNKGIEVLLDIDKALEKMKMFK